MSDATITALLDGGPLAEIHAAISARLLAAFPEATFGHKTFPAHLTPDAWGRVTERPPVVGLGLEMLVPNAGNSRVWRGVAQWQLLLVVKNSSSKLQMTGDAQRVGIFAMLSVAIAALQGLAIRDIGTVQVASGGPVYADSWANDQLSVAGLKLTVPFTMVDGSYLMTFDELLRVGVTWEGKEALPGPEVDDVRDP